MIEVINFLLVVRYGKTLPEFINIFTKIKFYNADIWTLLHKLHGIIIIPKIKSPEFQTAFFYLAMALSIKSRNWVLLVSLVYGK